jgi:enolase
MFLEKGIYKMSTIQAIYARQILDSRGFPTIEVEISVEGPFWAKASVPSGASTGIHEAHELRDQDTACYLGKGVKKAIKNIEEKIAPALIGSDVCNQRSIDRKLCELDSSPQKKLLGANATIGVSLACAHVAAKVTGQPLYRYLGGSQACRLPVPFMNIINGGSHADNNLDIQEFMIVPHGFSSFSEALRCGVEIYHELKAILTKKKLTTAIGDEGGFAPNLKNHRSALDLIIASIEKAGYIPAQQVSLALDVAASQFFHDKSYLLKEENKKFNLKAMIDYLEDLVEGYPIISIEDGLYEEDWEGFSQLTASLGDKIQIVGDDLFVTNSDRLQKGIEKKSANSILIKPNQIGTLSQTLECINLAHRNGFKTIISHRSGETEDTTIADLSVASLSGQIKTGAPCRSDRTCKYNQLLRIEEELAEDACFGFC